MKSEPDLNNAEARSWNCEEKETKVTPLLTGDAQTFLKPQITLKVSWAGFI